jgi:hypothetical protein
MSEDLLTSYTVQITEFKGNKMIELKSGPDDAYPFSFGVGKAKKILANVEAIEAFVEKYDKPKKPRSED